jgi:hypothetical protein
MWITSKLSSTESMVSRVRSPSGSAVWGSGSVSNERVNSSPEDGSIGGAGSSEDAGGAGSSEDTGAG